MLIQLDLMGIAASSGSACTTASLEPSHDLRAMGVSEETARGSPRVTVGKDNSTAEIDYLLEVMLDVVGRLWALSPPASPTATPLVAPTARRP
jgi:cysteine desulfurase